MLKITATRRHNHRLTLDFKVTQVEVTALHLNQIAPRISFGYKVSVFNKTCVVVYHIGRVYIYHEFISEFDFQNAKIA